MGLSSLRMGVMAAVLTGCAPKHLPEGYQPLPMDPAVFDCINAIGGRVEDIPQLRECLNRAEARARAEKPPFAEAPSVPVRMEESRIAMTKKVIPGRPSDILATVTPGENTLPFVNLTSSAPVLRVNPTHNRPLAREDWAVMGGYEVERDTDATGRVVQGVKDINYHSYPSYGVSSTAQIDQWTPEGDWGQMEVPLSDRSQEDILAVRALEHGQVGIVVGDALSQFPHFKQYGRDSGHLLMGSWNEDTLRKIELLDEEGIPFSLNGGFVEVDARTWLVSAHEGVLITRDAGQSWSKLDLNSGALGAYGTEGVKGYGVHQKGGHIQLSLIYEEDRFANYRWDAASNTWAYSGTERPVDPVEAVESATGDRRWEWTETQGDPIDYEAPNYPTRPDEKQTYTVNSHGGQFGLRFSQADESGVPSTTSTNVATVRINNNRAVGRVDFETDPAGSYNLQVLSDYDPSVNGKGSNGVRLFVTHTGPDGTLSTRELQLDMAPRAVQDAWLLNGHVMIAYQANPQERDYQKADIRVTAVPFDAIFPPEQIGSTQHEGTREYVPMTGYL